MLLQRLNEYADQLSLPPVLYGEAPVRYVIELDMNGRPRNRRPTDTADPTSPRTRRGQRRLAPQVQRASGIKPLLLTDKADYVLGLAVKDAKRAAECHRAFVELTRECAVYTKEPSVQAVLRFLENGPLEQLQLEADFDPTATITFRIEGTQFPVDLPAVQSFWAYVNDPTRAAAPVMQCVVCGQERPVLARLQAKVKGVPGGQTAGTSIISANAKAFESYGLEASLIAPTCADCGERFTKAANYLLADPTSRIIVGGAAFIFWTRRPVAGFSFSSFLTDPKPEDVRSLLDSVRSGRPNRETDDTAFYATALSASGGRTVVREWIDSTVGEAKRHLAKWFELQRIVDPFGDEPRPLSIYSLAGATVREMKDLSPPVPRILLRSAFAGIPLPYSLLAKAIGRNRAEQKVTRQRAALIKLVLLSHRPALKEDEMVKLDPEHPNPAYHCGRLFAVLEAVQRTALPGAKSNIVDRFFGTASSAPASVFARLLRGSQPHLAKLERDRRGAYIALQRRLEDVQARLSGFPRILTLEEQGLFALGYYHQRAFDRAEATAAMERRKAGLESPAEQHGLDTAILDNDNADMESEE